MIAGVTAVLLGFGVRVALRRTLLKSEDSATTRILFGWFVGGLGSFSVLAYYADGGGSPDSIAMGWALAVFGGYMVESGRLRQRIGELEARINSLGGSPDRQIPH
jgi:hypothetical protein